MITLMRPWLSLLAAHLLFLAVQSSRAQLSMDYYSKTCPQVEQIIHNVMVQKQKEAFVTAAGTLRIFFHDCFVQGCDASVLLVSTATNKAEKDADENLSLPGDGFDAVIRAKAAVEKVCPGVVSCADILSIATRDLVGLVGGPFWPVLKGRKDGRVSLASQVPGNLPLATMNVDQLTALFQKNGFTRDEMVILSGAHTIGFSHCDQFMKRIYGKVDPTMNATYAMQLRQACPNVNLDATTGRHGSGLQRRHHAQDVRQRLLQQPGDGAGPPAVRSDPVDGRPDARHRRPHGRLPGHLLQRLDRCRPEAKHPPRQDRLPGGGARPMRLHQLG